MRTNRAIALALSAVLSVPFLHGFAASAETQENDGLHASYYENYQKYLAAKSSGASASPSVIADGTAVSQAVLPSAYDLRSDGLMTSVKDQNPYGTCWTFASMASLESTIIARNPDADLSEWYLAYYTYSDVFGFAPTNADGDEVESRMNSGGNYNMAAAMLCSGMGPVVESFFPYHDYSVIEKGKAKTLDTLRDEAQYHVTDVVLFPYDVYDDALLQGQINAVKQAVYDGHAMVLNYAEDGACMNYETYGYYYDGDFSDAGYHAVTIVGWEDDYPAENFNTDPGMDGAWLIKNSWGADFGDNGYFWISYADPSIFDLYYLDMEPAEAHTVYYQYDDYGCWSSLSIADEGDEYAHMANVFTAEEDTWLTSVMFCTVMENENYEVKVYTDLRSTVNPSSGVVRASAEGVSEHAGYHTVDLDTPVFVEAGETFSVAVKLGGEVGYHITCESSDSIVETYADGTVEEYASFVTEDMLRADYSSGESFYSTNGKDWSDPYYESVSGTYTYEDANGDEVTVEYNSIIGNFCVKAFGQAADFVLFSDYSGHLPIGTEITLSAPSGEDIYYSVDGGAEQLYTEPILFTEDMQLTARTASGETYYEADYTVQPAAISSLLSIDEAGYKAYLSFRYNETEGYYYANCFYDEILPSYMEIQPISTGTITSSGEVLASGETAVILPSEEDASTYVLQVSQEGMTDSKYIIRFVAYSDILYGDVNKDGEVDANDATQLLMYAAAAGAGNAPALPDDLWPERADYNFDGAIDANDATEILVYAANAGAGNIAG